MIRRYASSTGWGIFLSIGFAAAMAGSTWQFAFAGLSIALLGLPHGASDWFIVAPIRRASFLVAYLACIVAVTTLWHFDPVVALLLLLILSIAHFAFDGMPNDRRLQHGAIGAFIVGGPAVLHRTDIAKLFTAAAGDATAAMLIAQVIFAVGILSVIFVAYGMIVHGRVDTDERMLELAAVGATLLFPPLVGFATGFVVLHARSQTTERQQAMRCQSLKRYLVRTAPLMAGAFVVLALVAVEMLRGADGSSAFLFAGIAALATPHMLVTPLWLRNGTVSTARNNPFYCRQRGANTRSLIA